MLWFFHWLVTRHLQRIAEFSARLDTDNLHEHLVLDRPAHKPTKLDEFKFKIKITTAETWRKDKIEDLGMGRVQLAAGKPHLWPE